MYRSRTSIQRARQLRREATDVEKLLWMELRGSRFEGVRFRRQHPIGPYVVDLCAPSIALVIELDGGQHDGRQAEDALRTGYLESRGYRVLRFWNHEVNQALPAVLERIWVEIQALRGVLR